MVRYCYDKGIKAGLSLNPLVMEQNIARRLINARPNLLFFALDGHDNDSFYKIRGVQNAYDKSKENVLSFLEIKKELGVKIKTVVSMIDFPDNKDSIDKMRDFWESLDGVDEVHLKPFTYWNEEIKRAKELVSEKDSSNGVGQTGQKKTGRIKKSFFLL